MFSIHLIAVKIVHILARAFENLRLFNLHAIFYFNIDVALLKLYTYGVFTFTDN